MMIENNFQIINTYYISFLKCIKKIFTYKNLKCRNNKLYINKQGG